MTQQIKRVSTGGTLGCHPKDPQGSCTAHWIECIRRRCSDAPSWSLQHADSNQCLTF